MKKMLALIVVSSFMLLKPLSVKAQYDGFLLGETGDIPSDCPPLILPMHDSPNNQSAPLGSGLLVLGALGAGYAALKKREK